MHSKNNKYKWQLLVKIRQTASDTNDLLRGLINLSERHHQMPGRKENNVMRCLSYYIDKTECDGVMEPVSYDIHAMKCSKCGFTAHADWWESWDYDCFITKE